AEIVFDRDRIAAVVQRKPGGAGDEYKTVCRRVSERSGWVAAAKYHGRLAGRDDRTGRHREPDSRRIANCEPANIDRSGAGIDKFDKLILCGVGCSVAVGVAQGTRRWIGEILVDCNGCGLRRVELLSIRENRASHPSRETTNIKAERK